MKIRLDTAKNASVTCSVDGRFLHSTYNPENEAEKFVESIECTYEPSCVILLGSTLPYCNSFLKMRFPNAQIYNVQYHSFFCENNEIYTAFKDNSYECSATFLCTHSTHKENFCEEIFSELGEIVLAAPLIIEWKAAASYFSNESIIAWETVRLLLQKTHNVLATRSYFSKRWLKNMFNFCIFTKNSVLLKKVEKPILLIASGYTLQKSIGHIKEYKDRFFVISLSSALECLVQNDIIPDMCISTDGGYYAKNHLDVLLKLHRRNIHIPLAVPAEGNVPKKILERFPIIPLTYNDGLEARLLKYCDISAMNAERNGTVSGTAAVFALSLTDENVYSVGLDLSVGNTYSHAQPNAHEKIHSLHDYRLKPLSSRISLPLLQNRNEKLSPMDIYRQWFSTRNKDFSKKFFRIVTNDEYVKTLGDIKDIAWESISFPYSTSNNESSIFFKHERVLLDSKSRKILLQKFISMQKETPCDEWLEHCALAEMLALQKHPQSKDCKEKLEEALSACFKIVEAACV